MNASKSEHLTPEEIAGVTFDSRFRGLDSNAVSAHLKRAADTVRALRSESDSLRADIERLQSEVASLQESAADQSELDESVLTERLGQEAARVLSEARAAAADRLAEAQAEADDILAEAEGLYAERSRAADGEADRIRADAETLLERRSEEAAARVKAIEAEAHEEAARIREAAKADRQASDAEGARIVREAQVARRQILEDLARRRSSARRQIEQLRAGRERLLASHEMVRRTLDEITEELNISMSEARAAAETAGHTVAESTIEELEAEIETARLSGLLDTGPVPVVDETDAADRVHAPEPVESSASDVPNAQAAGDMSNVVALDTARSEVDTASHPAAGRDATAESGGEARSGAELSSVAPLDGDAQDLDDAEGERVEDLFARMRSSQEEAAAEPKLEPDEPAEDEPALEVPDVSEVAEELARKLKRVLADEQSGVLSSLRSDEPGTVDDLLGDVSDHIHRYWEVARASAIEAFSIAAPNTAPEVHDIDSLRDDVADMVTGLRSRVDAAMGIASDDLDDAVERLRGIYREVKTRRIGEHAESVCADAAEIGAARGNDDAAPR